MERRSLAIAAVLLILAVAFGAFGAHGLKPRLTADALSQWHTAVEYQFIHALGILFLSAAQLPVTPIARRRAMALFLGGIVCFSGSLYLLSTRDLLATHALAAVLGPLTPVGGLLFIAGWGVLLITALRGDDAR